MFMLSSRRPGERSGVDDQDILEDRLLGLLAAGKAEEAATAAIKGYGPQVLRYLRSVLGNEDDSREAFSQFSENLWRGLPEFRGTAPFRIWAYRIAWNVACDMRKQPWRNRRRRLETGEATLIAKTVETSTGERVELRRQELLALREALSLDDRALAALRIDQGLSWAECAEVLSRDGRTVKPNTLTKRFERIKERLGALARKRGLLDR
jgi:RNA polymerase sigma-70 factor, ECF subfamily